MLELEDALQEDDEEKFTVDRLGAKFKWFKKEWRRIDNKIKCGTGLGRDDTKEPVVQNLFRTQHLRFSFDDQHLNSHFSENYHG